MTYLFIASVIKNKDVEETQDNAIKAGGSRPKAPIHITYRSPFTTNKIQETIEATKKTATLKRFETSTEKLKIFGRNALAFEIKQTKEMQELHERIMKETENLRQDIKKDKFVFAKYKPHMTIAYDVAEEKISELQKKPIKIAIDNICVLQKNEKWKIIERVNL
ncbi:2'-5' RNA ligase family protein [Candidatus Woesearchaeota archaeon]|nr:2'-5' RNA ligase family protein [Candidatus Woesearchaeota archaeon]